MFFLDCTKIDNNFIFCCFFCKFLLRLIARECSKLHHHAEDFVGGYWGCLRLSAGSARDIGVSSVLIDWVLLRVILPQMAQITQRGMQQAALFRRERQIGVSLAWGIVVLLFICDYLRDLREILWFRMCGLIEYSCVLFSRRWRRENAASCIISQRKTSCS